MGIWSKSRFFNVCGSPGTIEISIDRHSNFTLKKDVEGCAWVPLLDDHLKETSKRPMQWRSMKSIEVFLVCALSNWYVPFTTNNNNNTNNTNTNTNNTNTNNTNNNNNNNNNTNSNSNNNNNSNSNNNNNNNTWIYASTSCMFTEIWPKTKNFHETCHYTTMSMSQAMPTPTHLYQTCWPFTHRRQAPRSWKNAPPSKRVPPVASLLPISLKATPPFFRKREKT